MKRTLLLICILLFEHYSAFSQLDLHLEPEMVSDFSNYYGQADCLDFSEGLFGMSVYRLYIRTNGEQIKPFMLWGDQVDVMEFIPFGEVYNNSNNTNCSDLSCDTGWGNGGPIPFLDTWISMGGTPDGESDGLVQAGCCQVGSDGYSLSLGGNTTASAFLLLPASTVLQSPELYPLGQSLTTMEGTVSLTNMNVFQSSYQMDEVFLGQYVTNGPMVVRVNFSYLYQGAILENKWAENPGLEISFGYCFDQNACNYSPDFEVIGTGYEHCEYNSCTPCGGCMDEAATNYNEYADFDNGTCFFPDCTNELADNYNPLAYEEDGSCIFGNGTCAEAFNIAVSEEPILVGINEGNDASGAQYCWSEQADSEVVWFSFEASTSDMYVLSEPADGSLLDVAVLDACEGQVITCSENSDLYYSALTNLTIGQTYFIAFRSEPGSVFELSVGTGLVGCGNQNAINFQSGVDISFGCDFAGCTDPVACNYESNATVDDASCFYSGAILEGFVYRDFNLNNFPGFGEGVPNYPLTVLPGNDLIYTNATGRYYYETTDEGPYTIVATESVGVYEPEFIETVVEDQGDCTLDVNHIRLISLNEGPSYLCQGFPSIEEVFCVGESDFNFSVANDGDVPIIAQVTVTISPSNFFDFIQIPNGAELLADNQFFIDVPIASAQSVNLASAILANAVTQSNITITYDVVILDTNDELIAEESFVIPAEFLCSYDPNNKLAFPEGYAAPEFIANDLIHYVINFQNTGNYPAVNVLIRDSLDTDFLDLSTFEFLESSHSNYTTLSEDGKLEFYFENIHLPDSSSNEAESQGYVRFSIKPFVDLPHLTQIDNSALIYFDINEPISTNTVSRTLYYCGSEADVSAIPDFLCADDELTIEFENPYLDSTLWYVDDVLVSQDPLFLLESENEGVITLSWTGSNPLCTNSNEVEIVLESSPVLLYNGETGELFTEADGSYQWYNSNGLISGATAANYLPLEDGNYYVVVVSANGCEYQTEPFTVTNVDNAQYNSFVVYPNPVQDFLTIEFTDAALHTIELYSAEGKLIRSQVVNTSTHYLDMQELASGVYTLSVVGEGSVRVMR